MGGKLTKSKSASVFEKPNEESTKTSEDTNNQLDLTTDEKSKQLDKKNKKKKEPKLKKRSCSAMLDKSTNTENIILPETTYNEQLVGGKTPTLENIVSLTKNKIQLNIKNQTENLNNDVQELGNDSIQDDIKSAEILVENQQSSPEQEYQKDALNTINESPTDVSVACTGNSNQIKNEEQQQEQHQQDSGS